MEHYDAPWSNSLKVISLLSTILCLGVAGTFIYIGHPALLPAAILPVALVLGTAMFTVRGYTLTPDSIMVRRLFWQTVLPLTSLQSAEFDPTAMKSSIRVGGNGGMFSFSGFFWNQSLGTYRALATDLSRSVILRYPDRKIVISPSDPKKFVRHVSGQLNTENGATEQPASR